MRLNWCVRVALAGLLVALPGVAGCGGGGGGDGGGPPPQTGVSGTVTLDGVPMGQGQIMFLDAAGEGAPAFLDVTDGRFEGSVPHGKKKVQIQSFKKSKLKTGEDDPIGVQVVHSDYNSNSKLTADVNSSGVTPSEFKVTSIR